MRDEEVATKMCSRKGQEEMVTRCIIFEYTSAVRRRYLKTTKNMKP
jgi:hypothetical protein